MTWYDDCCVEPSLAAAALSLQLSPSTIASRLTRGGQTVIVVSASPSSPAKDHREETFGGGPLSVFAIVMMTGGDCGLPRGGGWGVNVALAAVA